MDPNEEKDMIEVCVKIADCLFLGNRKSGMSKTTLAIHNIKSILIAGIEMDPLYPDSYTYMKLEVFDSADDKILYDFDRVFEFIEEGISKGGILVHCIGGVSRSPSIIIAYLMKKNKMNYDEAYKLVYDLKTDIKPNEGFVFQLKKFDEELNKKVENVFKCS